MKLSVASSCRRRPGETGPSFAFRLSPSALRRAGFTMIEIALCLAIIGFALISILLILPVGMNTQRFTREQTIIGQDASVLLQAISSGDRGMDDLTNYVYAITNYYQNYDAQGQPLGSGHKLGYTYTLAALDNLPRPAMCLTNGLRIIGLLSTPEYTTRPPQDNIGAVVALSLPETYGNSYTSNYVTAYVRSFSGLAAEKPPQDNTIMQGDTFSYQIRCVNAPLAADAYTLTNPPFNPNSYAWQLAANTRELRLLFMWPQQPNGQVGGWRQTFRTTVAGQLLATNYSSQFPKIDDLFFYQSGSFATNNPP